GLQAIERIKADPYTLTLLEPWAEVDARALRLGLTLDDKRRLCSAVEEALAVRFRQGHMAAPSSSILPLVQHLAAPWGGDPDRALEIAVEAGRIIAIGNDLLQSRACWFMEHELERFFGERLTPHAERRAYRSGGHRRCHQEGRSGGWLPTYEAAARSCVHGD
ncbi:helix-hairpin-helix domain-containing protein, partial [Xanthomonas citri pv. citri]